MKLIAYRGLIGAALVALLMLWMAPSFYPESIRTIWMATGVFSLLLLVQAGLHTFSRLPEVPALLFQFTTDIGLAGVLIYATGGITSPFSFLLGLIVLASGTFGRIMLPLGSSVFACIVYLVSIYSASAVHDVLLDPADALHALLQTSAIFLVGGVMAFIARRHLGLRRSSDRAVQQHRKLKGFHTRVMSAMREGVIVMDGRLRLQDMNSAARYLLAEQNQSDIETLSSFLKHMPGLRHRLNTGDTTDYHGEYDRHGRKLLVFAKALDAGGGEDEPAWLLTLVDISALRRLEEKLIEQEKMAALGQMSAMLAHEIRNPIQTMAQGLELMKSDEDHRVTVQEILHDEMLRLNRLVGMMLDYSKPLSASPYQVEMSPLMEQAVHQADLKGENMNWRCEVDALHLDPDHFRLVIDNLLSNALQNRLKGSEVEVQLVQRGDSWVLRVCNEGVIPEDMRDKLFQPYVSGRSVGAGLGLSTVKQVCELNGWTIHVEENDSRVCFEVSAPWAEDQPLNEENPNG